MIAMAREHDELRAGARIPDPRGLVAEAVTMRVPSGE